MPFIVLIIAVALWFMSMDLAPWISGSASSISRCGARCRCGSGSRSLIVACVVDYRSRGGDFAFWLHLFGLMAFWGGISATSGATELDRAVYCLFNVGLLFAAVILLRRAYAVFGTFGITLYLGDLADVVFKDSLLFPFALSLIGIARHRRRAILSSQAAGHRRLAHGEPARGGVALAAGCGCAMMIWVRAFAGTTRRVDRCLRA